VRVFKTKWFVRYARQERIGDHSLRKAIEHAIKEGLLQEASYDEGKQKTQSAGSSDA